MAIYVRQDASPPVMARFWSIPHDFPYFTQETRNLISNSFTSHTQSLSHSLLFSTDTIPVVSVPLPHILITISVPVAPWARKAAPFVPATVVITAVVQAAYVSFYITPAVYICLPRQIPQVNCGWERPVGSSRDLCGYFPTRVVL